MLADERLERFARHIVLPEIDPELPVTLSSEGIGYLRSALGLDGLLMTDDISMGALDGVVAERGERALAAGCDLVLHCNGDLGEMEALAERTGEMSAAARKRADIALSRRRTPIDIDISLAESEFLNLIESGPGQH